jgi:translation initiation factor 2 subunit 1
MSESPSDWPEVGDLIVATVVRVVGHGAYVTLDEYDNKEGLLHISEISSSWVRNIRNHVRERQKVVLNVRRVDPSRSQIDLSLRRVTQDDKRKKLEEWKKNRKAEGLLRSAAVSLKMSEEDIFKKAGLKLVEHYGSLYTGLEAAAKNGAEALHEAGLTKKISKTLAEVVKDKIVIKGVSIDGVIEITSMESNGVEAIKNTLLAAKEMASENDAEAVLTSLGAPKYRIEVLAEDYKIAEATMEKIVEATTKTWADHDGSFTYTRE